MKERRSLLISPGTKSTACDGVQEATENEVCGGVGRCLGTPSSFASGSFEPRGFPSGCQLPTETKHFDNDSRHILLRHTSLLSVKLYNNYVI